MHPHNYMLDGKMSSMEMGVRIKFRLMSGWSAYRPYIIISVLYWIILLGSTYSVMDFVTT